MYKRLRVWVCSPANDMAIVVAISGIDRKKRMCCTTARQLTRAFRTGHLDGFKHTIPSCSLTASTHLISSFLQPGIAGCPILSLYEVVSNGSEYTDTNMIVPRAVMISS
jgi:hypothetical protein